MNRLFTLSFVEVAFALLAAFHISAAEKPVASPKVVAGTEQDVTAVFTVRIVHRGKQAIQKPEIRMRLPVKDAHQEIESLAIEGKPRHERDRWNSEAVVYRQPELPPGGVMSGRWTATCRLRELQWDLKSLPSPVPGEGSGVRAVIGHSSSQDALTLTLSGHHAVVGERGRQQKLSKEERALYLRDTDRYGIHTPAVHKAMQKATARREGEVAKLEGIHDYVMDRIKYVIDDYWEPAPKVLARGTGSCSEFTYSFIALCRAAGIPARFVGGIVGRPNLPYHVDLIFHRFPQAFVEGVGWVDFDPTRNRRSKNRRLYFGRTPRKMLLLCAGDGGEGSLTGWDYRAATSWNGKKVKPYANETDDNDETVVIDVGWWFPTPSAEVRRKIAAFRKQWEETPPDRRQPLIAEALKINHPLTLPWLDDLLYDPAARTEAARAFIQIGGQESLRAIVDSLGRLNDRESDHRIGEILGEFTGKKYGANRKRWEKWLKARTPPSPVPDPLPRPGENTK
ncbi:MAG: transglutaminase domain-containing protein [Pirellulales bacterium]|nr:transglutaminase domain-containing protein [Pirellulales bacterium]